MSFINAKHNLNIDIKQTFDLQKVAVKEEKVEEEAKKAKVTSVKKKAEELPEIADYDRPDLEKFEKPEFTQTTKDKPEAKVRNKTIETKMKISLSILRY